MLHSIVRGEHGTLSGLEDDGIQVIAAQTSKPLSRTAALPGDMGFVTCPQRQGRGPT